MLKYRIFEKKTTKKEKKTKQNKKNKEIDLNQFV